jgi:hypothetical protein
VTPKVLYPAINEKNFVKSPNYDKLKLSDLVGNDKCSDTKKPRILTSLNRYERKKDIGMALRAFA